MDAIKKFLGVLWMLLAPALVIMMIRQFIIEIPELEKAIAEGKKPASELQSAYIFWIITITIFVPIATGLGLFGYYALKDEYKQIATSSAEL
jgi:ABC-type Co2+ transport system permease subunit